MKGIVHLRKDFSFFFWGEGFVCHYCSTAFYFVVLNELEPEEFC